MQKTEKTKLAIVDDCVIFRTGLRCILSEIPNFEIIMCRDFNSGENIAFSEPPDVILIHSTTKDLEFQAEMLNRAKEAAPLAKVLLISEFSDMDYLLENLMSGCDGYVLRDVSENALIRAVTNVSTEIFVFDRNAIGKFLQMHGRGSSLGSARKLSSREMRVVEMVSEGMTNEKIASELELATGTVKNIVSDLLSRFKYQKRSQLVKLLNEAL